MPQKNKMKKNLDANFIERHSPLAAVVETQPRMQSTDVLKYSIGYAQSAAILDEMKICGIIDWARRSRNNANRLCLANGSQGGLVRLCLARAGLKFDPLCGVDVHSVYIENPV